MPPSLRNPIAALTVIAAAGVLAAGAPAAGGLPLAPAFLPSNASNHGLKVRPATIVFTGDGTGFLGGANVRSSRIHWSSWTASAALGTGYEQLNDCVPSCAGGRYRGYAARIELWRPRTIAGELVFTRMTLFYQHGRPAGQPSHYTFTDVHGRVMAGGFGWSPPTVDSYCTHTDGLPPFAGCANIHSLP